MSHRDCPSHEELLAFHFGRLPVPALDALREHLESCRQCEASVQTFDQMTDPVIAALRGPAGGALAAGPTRALGAGAGSAPTPPGDESPSLEFLAPAQADGELGRLAHFRVLKVLGQGGMGIVFLAEDSLLKRRVALKVLRPALAHDRSARERFLREAQAVAALRSEHVVIVHQVGEAGPVPYMAMELLDGETLDAWRLRQGAPTVPQLVRIATEIALGLAAAHERGLIHRDIKPSNVWLERRTDGDFRVKLLDFGLVLAAIGETRLTRQGTLVGTPAYMAPEMAEGKGVDERCDLFSLGSVLYYLATGVAPFGGDSTVAALWAVSFKTPTPLRQLRADLPPALAELVMQMLAKEPGKRPTSARAVAGALRVIAFDRAPAASRWRRWAQPAAFLTGLLVLTVGWAALLPTATKPTPPVQPTVAATQPALPAEEKAWLASVADLPPKEQLAAVVARLKKLNPGYDGTLGNRVTLTHKDVTELSFPSNHVTDLAPLKALTKLQYLECGSHVVGQRSPLADLTPLAKLPLRELRVAFTSVASLTPLQGMPLNRLDMAGTLVRDLSPLRGVPTLTMLVAGQSAITDLAPLQDLPLVFLTIERTRVADLGPLSKMPLRHLDCNETLVASLAPLAGKPMVFLKCIKTPVTSLEPLRGMKVLEVLSAPVDRQRDAALLQGITSLRSINDLPAAEFWKLP